MADDKILLKIQADISDIKKKLNTVGGDFKNTSNKMQAESKKLNQAFKKVGAGLKTAFKMGAVAAGVASAAIIKMLFMSSFAFIVSIALVRAVVADFKESVKSVVIMPSLRSNTVAIKEAESFSV